MGNYTKKDEISSAILGIISAHSIAFLGVLYGPRGNLIGRKLNFIGTLGSPQTTRLRLMRFIKGFK
jgi:hypothetical protein